MVKKQVVKQIGKITKLINGDNHYFFGYYGKSPWNKTERYTVCLEVGFIDRHPKRGEAVNIILIDNKKGIQKKIAETRAWNWQQGCMMQWMPNSENKIIFNDRLNGKFISRILDIKTLREEVVPYSIYDVTPSGTFATGVSFEKLDQVRRGYGYIGGINICDDDKNEGVFLIDLKRGKRKIVVSLDELKKYRPIKSMGYGKHWVDQPIFSPDGKRICFLHRWEIGGGLFHSRFFTVGVDGRDLFIFPDSGFYSHFCWKSSNEILMFCSVSKKFGNVRSGDLKSKILLNFIRPIYRKVVPRFLRKRVIPIGYYLLKDLSSEMKKINIYNDDGHPSFSKNGRYVISDTYPNSKGYRKLILYDWLKKKRFILGEFYSLPNKKYLSRKIKDFGNSPFRVDLHPRWNFVGDKVCFDSIHEGKRGVYFVDFGGHHEKSKRFL